MAKCIVNHATDMIERVDNETAEKAVKSGRAHYSPKWAWKKQRKELKEGSE